MRRPRWTTPTTWRCATAPASTTTATARSTATRSASPPGLSLVYTDEAHGYGNAGVDDPPAQSPLDSQPEPGSATPDLNDAAWTAAAGDVDVLRLAASGHTDNYQDPATPTTGTPWVFRFDCLGFQVTSMSGAADGPATSDGDLTGNVQFDMGEGCGTFDYGYPEPARVANTAPTAALSAAPTRVTTGRPVTLKATGSTDAQTPEDLDYVWDFGNGGTPKDAVGPNATATYNTSGTKQVTLTVTDPLGEADTAAVDVTVVESPKPATTKHVNCQSGTVTRHGSWRTVRGGRADDGNYCDNQGNGRGTDRLTYTFSGPLLDVLYGRSQAGGSAKVWIDGERQSNLSFRGERDAARINGRERYAGLGDGRHTIRIEVVRRAAYLEGFVTRG